MASRKISFFILLALLFSSSSEGRDFLVDGQQNSWKIPSTPDQFNQWASKTRFRIGDSLVMEYDPKSDSVLEVTQADYKNCNKTNPIKSFHDGKTKIVLNRSGPLYFISGTNDHCEKGQKLEVQVLSAKHSGQVVAHSPAMAPSTIKHLAPAPAPAPASGTYRLKIEELSAPLALIMASFVGFGLF